MFEIVLGFSAYLAVLSLLCGLDLIFELFHIEVVRWACLDSN